MCNQGNQSGNDPWGYGERNGPAVWGDLDPAYRVCSLGAEQSPIDLAGGRKSELPEIEFDYRRAGATIENNGHSIQVNPAPGSGVVLDGMRHELRQFHFHRGSEHTVEGVQLDLEMHLVHESDRGQLLVIGVLYGEGRESAALAPVWARLPPQPTPPRALPDAFDLAALLPESRAMWRYRGSLTTPPCTEGVAWTVFAEPLTLSAAQIQAFAAIYSNNFRPVQPLGERVLYRCCGDGASTASR